MPRVFSTIATQRLAGNPAPSITVSPQESLCSVQSPSAVILCPAMNGLALYTYSFVFGQRLKGT